MDANAREYTKKLGAPRGTYELIVQRQITFRPQWRRVGRGTPCAPYLRWDEQLAITGPRRLGRAVGSHAWPASEAPGFVEGADQFNGFVKAIRLHEKRVRAELGSRVHVFRGGVAGEHNDR